MRIRKDEVKPISTRITIRPVDPAHIVQKLIGCFIASLALCIADASAQAPSTASGQAYPVKAVRVLLGTAPGGTGDISARMFTQKMAESLGQPFVVESRPGAGGAIAD